LNDLSAPLADEAVAAIRAEGGSAAPVPGDVGDLKTLDRLVGEAVGQFGSVDMAVANAGITTFGDFFEYQPESFRQLLDVNLQGSFFLAQYAARQMRRQGKGGRILFMSSVTGRQAYKYLSAYGMTKAALQMLAKSLVPELSPLKITVNAIAPGATLTERTQATEGDYAEIWNALSPTGRVSTPLDIAAVALFLLSPAASQITGQTIVVDGGWSASSPMPPDGEKA
jgi:3-oxoacyl-[acyl-carrier protein] reductase